MARVEQRVENLYYTIELNSDERDRVEQIVLATLRQQQAVNDERLAEITEETETNQTKLVDAYYADSIGRELFLTHQRRLNAVQCP
ncbi:hypothetical protein JL108_10335 [Aeromicrobium sp. YIM 150415]|uniref:hypothetical protein n=1 Tax=Aeromicrobium sp. YIM 150415 TaxID=2803912 RepID=UPI001965DBD2|nr:hypothetical protein [Aeromicrobium sp. YIM 150415]MBM9463844.1 hypothetical protein [Aeromicrobium sp. YIM 150415]